MTSNPEFREAFTSPQRYRLEKTILCIAVVVALLADAIGSTVFSFARSDINGAFSTTQDQYSLLIITYVAAKIGGYLFAPCTCAVVGARASMSAALSVITTGFAWMTLSDNWFIQLGLVACIGASGGVLVVSGQTLLFLSFPRRQQPIAQTFYALGSAAGAASIAPAIEGWMLLVLNWRWIPAAAVGIALLASILLRLTAVGRSPKIYPGTFNTKFFVFAMIGTTCAAYISTQGDRWNWFEAPHILLTSLVGFSATLLAIRYLIRKAPEFRMLDLTIFRELDFSFAFLASFVAGFALFGTGFLIPAYSTVVLGMNSSQLAELLLPGVFSFFLAMCVSAFALPILKVPMVLTVPLGVAMLILAMWQLSLQGAGAGVSELLPAILIRGGSLGFLFLAITLMAMMALPEHQVAHGSALLFTARQIGGLAGTGLLGSLVTRQTELNSQILSGQLIPGNPILATRTAELTDYFYQNGMTSSDATRTAIRQLGLSLSLQANDIAWSRAFLTVAAFLLLAAPILVLYRLFLTRFINRQSH
ncbi:MFS transporter [Roseovarius sp. B08]|uniref:MFS transporter n=1 Tax=Roseovarius sp. B08 TaxID=3449223 RepID=UPI003EDC8AEA